MATVHHAGCPLRDSFYWDETECLNYYGMLSLQEVFEIVGSQMTEMDIEVLSFFLDETCPIQHPLDPAGWTVEPHEVDSGEPDVSPSPELLKAWRRLQSKGFPCNVAPYKPRSGVELLLEMERRGYISDGNLEPLLQLLRILTRHDLLPFVSCKKRRTVSPETHRHNCVPENRELASFAETQHTSRSTEMPLPSFTQEFGNATAVDSSMPAPGSSRRRKKRGHGWSRKPKRTKQNQPHPPPPPPPHKVSCG